MRAPRFSALRQQVSHGAKLVGDDLRGTLGVAHAEAISLRIPTGGITIESYQ